MLNQDSAASSVEAPGLCITGCAAMQRQSGLLCVQSAGQQLLPNRAADTEEHARRIAAKQSDEASGRHDCFQLHQARLASAHATGIIRLVRDGSEVGAIQPLFLGDCTVSLMPMKNHWVSSG